MELGLAFRSFGSEVTIIEKMDRLVPNMDEDISTFIEELMEEKGIRVLTSAELMEIKEKTIS